MNHFVIENDITLKPLGIAYAYLSSQTAVCRIKEIIKKLGLTIVKYRSSPLLNISEDKVRKWKILLKILALCQEAQCEISVSIFICC